MATAEQVYFRSQLEQRRDRLLSALHSSADDSLSHLLSEVDAALDRMEVVHMGCAKHAMTRWKKSGC